MNAQRLFQAATVFAVVALWGCGGKDDTQQPGGGSGGGGEVTPPAVKIEGTAKAMFHPPSGETQEPINLRSTFISALIPQADGTVRSVSGVASADGTFEIPTAPEGFYWLRIYDGDSGQDQYLLTDQKKIDLQIDVAGRADEKPASIGTMALINAMPGLSPWQDADGLSYVSGNLGAALPLPIWPTTGDTDLTGSVPWDFWPLPDKDKGDDGMIVQYRHTTDPATSLGYYSVVKSAQLQPLTVDDGQVTIIDGELKTPADFTYSLSWKRSAFAALQTQIQPHLSDTPLFATNTLVAMPGGAEHGVPVAVPPTVFEPDGDAFGAATDDLSHDYAIFNPFPASWLVNRSTMVFPVTFPVPGDPDQFGPMAQAAVGVENNTMPSATAPVVPLISPVKALQIAGKDATVDQSGVGVRPKLSWAAPDIGTPSSYFISVYRWDGLDQPSAALVEDAILIVPGSLHELDFPAGLLKAGSKYVINVEARTVNGEDVAAHGAYSRSPPMGWADGFTATISP